MKIILAAFFALCLLSVGAYVWVSEFDDALEMPASRAAPSSTPAGASHALLPVAEQSASEPTANHLPNADSSTQATPPQRPFEAVSNRVPATEMTSQRVVGSAAQPVYDLFSDEPTRPVYPAAEPLSSAAMTPDVGPQPSSQEFQGYSPEKRAIAQATAPPIDPAEQAAADRIAQSGKPPKHH